VNRFDALALAHVCILRAILRAMTDDTPTVTDTITLTRDPGAGSLGEASYRIGELIGRGGMGEVVAATDVRIGREVAIKRIGDRAPSDDAVTRFLREARTQARLDHRSIVPVYELGTDSEGQLYFTMKRVVGTTLAKRLTDGAAIQPLLRGFADVCLAIELAHSRRIIHRDLKPSNIMFADYGEVFVLDWGVARVLDEALRQSRPALEPSAATETTAGAILGTPGYMAPEQVRGQDVGPAADVYALGAILFELLAGEPLHPRGEGALGSTLMTPQQSPAQRVPHRVIAPELDAACSDALAADPATRPSARQLAERIQAYLDGDRDLGRRRALAAEQLVAARDALAAGDRATGMRRAGRALALDPESHAAAELVGSLLISPPEKLPPELERDLETQDLSFNADRARVVFLAGLFMFLLPLLMPLLDIKSYTNVAAFYVPVLFAAVLLWATMRSGKTIVPFVLGNALLLLVTFTRVIGPFVITPVVGCFLMFVLAANPAVVKRRSWIVTWAAVAATAPFVLEWTHVFSSTYHLGEGSLASTSAILYLHDNIITHVVLIATQVVFFVITGVIVASLHYRRRQAQRRVDIQAWHLRQLLPARKS
jgi:serine/threonine-protein kinase